MPDASEIWSAKNLLRPLNLKPYTLNNRSPEHESTPTPPKKQKREEQEKAKPKKMKRDANNMPCENPGGRIFGGGLMSLNLWWCLRPPPPLLIFIEEEEEPQRGRER